MARPSGHKDPTYLVDTVRQEQITLMHFVPSMLQAFVDEGGVGECGSLRRVTCSGEVLPAPVVRQFQERLGSELDNPYGPTEAAVDVTAWRCERGGEGARVPIGRPVANTQIYILDEYLRPVPVGVAGELYIGGVQVGRGYVNRGDLTAERFIPDGYGKRAGGRLYKTGDMGRYQGDGSIEYLGRRDEQVKVRGYRIELGEIEAQLRQHRQVKEAVVIVREDRAGEKRLVAYVVGEAVEPPSSVQLRNYLVDKLPGYMVPSAIVVMESMTLTANGKVDRKALPAPEAVGRESQSYEAPQGAVEEILAGIWQELLQVERVGRHDKFFELGGHSLLAVQVTSRVREIFKV